MGGGGGEQDGVENQNGVQRAHKSSKKHHLHFELSRWCCANPPLRSQSSQMFSLFKPGVSRNKSLYALPTANDSAMLISGFLVHSGVVFFFSSFFFSQIRYKSDNYILYYL